MCEIIEFFLMRSFPSASNGAFQKYESILGMWEEMGRGGLDKQGFAKQTVYRYLSLER